MRAEEDSRVKQIAEDRITEEGKRSDVARREPREGRRIDTIAQPGEEIRYYKKLNAAEERHRSDAKGTGSLFQEPPSERYVQRQAPIDNQSGPGIRRVSGSVAQNRICHQHRQQRYGEGLPAAQFATAEQCHPS